MDPIASVKELRKEVPNRVVVDARPDPKCYAAEGHLTRAVYAHLETALSAPAEDAAFGGRHPLPEVQDFCERLGSWGIGPDTDVIVYDAYDGSNAASRFWWMLRALGHQRVRVLERGYRAIIAAGLPCVTTPPVIEPREPYPATVWGWPLVELNEVEQVSEASARGNASQLIVDVRSTERFRGDREPIDPLAGHLPGASNLPFAENLEADGRFKSGAALRTQYERFLGDVTPDRVIVHCGSGVTACHTLLALERAGLPGAALYVGSFSEWCRRYPDRVIRES